MGKREDDIKDEYYKNAGPINLESATTVGEKLEAENDRLKAINAELLAACERALQFVQAEYPRIQFAEAIANAQPQGERVDD